MNWQGYLLWGFTATALLTTLMRAGQALGLARIDLPFMLGTMLTPDRDRAKVIGFLMHFLNGWIFTLLYAAYFHLIALPRAVGLLKRKRGIDQRDVRQPLGVVAQRGARRRVDLLGVQAHVVGPFQQALEQLMRLIQPPRAGKRLG